MKQSIVTIIQTIQRYIWYSDMRQKRDNRLYFDRVNAIAWRMLTMYSISKIRFMVGFFSLHFCCCCLHNIKASHNNHTVKSLRSWFIIEKNCHGKFGYISSVFYCIIFVICSHYECFMTFEYAVFVFSVFFTFSSFTNTVRSYLMGILFRRNGTIQLLHVRNNVFHIQ